MLGIYHNIPMLQVIVQTTSDKCAEVGAAGPVAEQQQLLHDCSSNTVVHTQLYCAIDILLVPMLVCAQQGSSVCLVRYTAAV